MVGRRRGGLEKFGDELERIDRREDKILLNKILKKIKNKSLANGFQRS